MAVISNTQKCWIEAQGFVGHRDEELAQFGPWLRLTTGLCTAWMLIGTAMASPVILAGLIPFAFLGAVMKNHPFDTFYNDGLRYSLGTMRIPTSGKPRRFACAVATVWLLATVLAFQMGAMTAGYVLGYSLTLAALSPSTIGFCIPSYFYGLIFGPPTADEGKVC